MVAQSMTIPGRTNGVTSRQQMTIRRLAAAKGTFSRSDNRCTKSDAIKGVTLATVAADDNSMDLVQRVEV
ncbi:hypothetical protein PHMEG_0005599 [Phytophthora megakarya]|uniref:Uncharacterized protein n=1 Tax=Phytophthora megakarya TaxID=4795 RepID=A0A225WQQ2_9STRA|nr:hypothetical protein PHMEG_0005599 [Phytophthora megakarya]